MNEFIITAIGILIFAIVFAFDNKQTKKTDEIRGDVERLKMEIKELKK